jgi:hypothetical protein
VPLLAAHIEALLASAADSEPSSWDQFFTRFQAVGPTVAAFVVLGGAVLTIWQKSRTDRRELWWTRVQWAADKSVDPDPGSRDIGAAALASLAAEKVKHAGDRNLLGAIANNELADVAKLVAAQDSHEALEFELAEGDPDGEG